MAASRGRKSAAGRTVDGVEMQGITDEASRELLARLPVHAGDMLTHESIDALRAVVREFDAHLELGFSLRGDHEVAIQIRTGGVR